MSDRPDPPDAPAPGDGRRRGTLVAEDPGGPGPGAPPVPRSARPLRTARPRSPGEPGAAPAAVADSLREACREHLALAVDKLRRAHERTRLYGLRHPEAQAAVDDAWAPLSEAVSLISPLKVLATLDGTVWEGDFLVAEDDDKPGIGRLLHREGIQLVGFHQGMTREELVRLLDVLRVNLGLPEYEEETLDSLLWQADLPHVTHKAVAAIMRAEAISGDVDRFLKKAGVTKAQELVSNIKAVGRKQTEHRLSLDEAALTRALDGAGEDVAVLQDADGWDDELPADAWERRYAQEAEKDADAIAALSSEIAHETPGDVTARLGALLLDLARERRRELPAAEALTLAEGALGELMRLHSAGGYASLLAAIDEDIAAEQSLAVRERLQAFQKAASDPTLVARVLAHSADRDTAGEDQDASEKLLSLLDESAIRALVEWSFGRPPREEEDEEASVVAWLDSALGDAAARRARAWLSEAHGRPELLVPGVRLLRQRDQPEDRALRPHLLGHEAGRVVEETLAWYADTGMAEADLQALLAMMLDRRPRIRQAARGPLQAVEGPLEDRVRAWFAQHLRPDSLARRDAAVQRELCEAAADVLGERALRMLRSILLEHKVGLFAGKDDAALMEAAAAGLVRLATPQARATLQEGSGGWVRARSQACKAALSRFRLRTEGR